jgi:hypothetical protein
MVTAANQTVTSTHTTRNPTVFEAPPTLAPFHGGASCRPASALGPLDQLERNGRRADIDEVVEDVDRDIAGPTVSTAIAPLW